MLIAGDVLAVVAALVGICASLWALMLVATLLFESKAAAAAEEAEVHPVKSLLAGLLVLLVVGVPSLAILNVPLPLAKAAGWTMLMIVLSVAAVGGGGLAVLCGERMRQRAPHLSDLGAASRGAGVLVLATLVPIFGWFFLGPLLLVLALGSGSRALWIRSRNPQPA
jgi:hypothetical protein